MPDLIEQPTEVDRRDERPRQSLGFRALVRVVTTLIAILMWCWMKTFRITVLGEEHDLGGRAGGHAAYATWHRAALLAIFFWRRRRGYMIASASKDGEWAAQLIERFGNTAVRGSSSRGGRAALKEIGDLMVATGASGGFLTDAPRGPERVSKAGILVLAQRTGLPIVAAQFAAARCKRLRSWDRTIIPLPFSRVVVKYGAPFAVDPALEGEGFDRRLAEFDAHMNQLTDEVDAYFATA